MSRCWRERFRFSRNSLGFWGVVRFHRLSPCGSSQRVLEFSSRSNALFMRVSPAFWYTVSVRKGSLVSAPAYSVICRFPEEERLFVHQIAGPRKNPSWAWEVLRVPGWLAICGESSWRISPRWLWFWHPMLSPSVWHRKI